MEKLTSFSFQFIVVAAASTLCGCHGANSNVDPLGAPAGRVTFEQRFAPTSGQPPAYLITACFWAGGPAGPSDAGPAPSCRGANLDGCCVGAEDPGLEHQGCMEQNVDVGQVQLLRNGQSAWQLALRSGSYVETTGRPLAWNPGDKLEVRGGGVSGIPPFDVAVAAPIPPTLSAPALTLGDALTIPRTQPLSFAWQSVPAIGSESWITATDLSSGSLISVDCGIAGDPGTQHFDVPLLELLPAGLGTTKVALENQGWQGAFEAVGRGEAEIAVETQ